MTEPREYRDLVEGEIRETSGITITETHVVLFAGLTGDFHPVHMNEEVAKTTQFGGRIAHGPLIFALATGLFTQADKLNSIAFLGMDWRFLKPVALGDTVRVRSELIEKRLTKSGDRAIARHKRQVLNQRDEVVEEGETSVMMLVNPDS